MQTLFEHLASSRDATPQHTPYIQQSPNNVDNWQELGQTGGDAVRFELAMPRELVRMADQSSQGRESIRL